MGLVSHNVRVAIGLVNPIWSACTCQDNEVSRNSMYLTHGTEGILLIQSLYIPALSDTSVLDIFSTATGKETMGLVNVQVHLK